MELQHDVEDPDPLCEGDNPCICMELERARQQAGELVKARCVDAAMRSAGRSPTLGQQRMLRALQEVQP
jgi:hypothetical protein